MKFWVNDDIDMTQITDSMQLDSDTQIASMEFHGITAYLDVKGEVKVWWNSNAETDDLDEMFKCGDYYKYPSEFPQELKDLIKEDRGWDCDPRVYVSENNWFDLAIFYDDEYIGSDVVDVEGFTYADLFNFLHESISAELQRKENFA